MEAHHIPRGNPGVYRDLIGLSGQEGRWGSEVADVRSTEYTALFVIPRTVYAV